MNCYRSILGVSRLDHTPNKDVLALVDQVPLAVEARTLKLNWLGKILRRPDKSRTNFCAQQDKERARSNTPRQKQAWCTTSPRNSHHKARQKQRQRTTSSISRKTKAKGADLPPFLDYFMVIWSFKMCFFDPREISLVCYIEFIKNVLQIFICIFDCLVDRFLI